MGFYYGSGKPPDDEPGGFKETLLIIWVVFQTLALPMGILLGGLSVLVLLFVLFAAHPLVGLSGLLAIVAAVVGYGAWEAKHPPEIK